MAFMVILLTLSVNVLFGTNAVEEGVCRVLLNRMLWLCRAKLPVVAELYVLRAARVDAAELFTRARTNGLDILI